MHTEVMGRRHIDEDQNERGPYWAVQAPSTRQSRASDLRDSVRTQEYRERTDLPGSGKFARRLPFREQFGLCLAD